MGLSMVSNEFSGAPTFQLIEAGGRYGWSINKVQNIPDIQMGVPGNGSCISVA